MRVRAASSLILVAIVAFTPAARASGEDVAASIRGLIDRAMAAPSFEAADKDLTQANVLLATEGGKIERVAREFLQADLRRARGAVEASAWQRDPDKHAGLKDRARGDLLSALAGYRLLSEACDLRAQRIEANLTGDPSDSAAWREAIGQISRANYAAAWTEYHLALVAADKAERDKQLASAIEGFLGFTAGGYRENAIVADCFLGQALCLHEQGRDFDALRLLRDATAKNTPTETFKRMTWLRIQAGKALPSDLEIENAASAWFDSLPATHRMDTMDLEIAMDRAAALSRLADPKANPEFHARFARRLADVAAQVEQYGEPWRSRVMQIMGKSAGDSPVACLERARKAFAEGKFEQAAAQAAQGLGRPVETPATVLADLRYIRFAASWNQKQWRDVVEIARSFIANHAADARARDVAAKGLQAALLARQQDPPLAPSALIDYLDAAETAFPRHPDLAKAPWYRAAALIDSGNLNAAAAQLERIPPDGPLAPWLHYGRALVAWRRAVADPEKVDEAQLAAAAGHLEHLLAAIKTADAKDRAVLVEPASQVVLAVGRSLLTHQEPAAEPAGRLHAGLAALSPFGEPADRADALGLLLDVQAGSVDRAVDRLAGLNGDTKYAIAGDIVLLLDRRLQAVLPAKGEGLAWKANWAMLNESQQGRATSDALLLAGACNILREQADSPALRLRAADALRRVGHLEPAAANYQAALRKLPPEDSGAALRGLALAREQQGQFTHAITHWQKLAAGLADDTDAWTEARYHLIVCYAQIPDMQDHARKLLKLQLLRMRREGQSPWPARFDGLALELGVRMEPPASNPDE